MSFLSEVQMGGWGLSVRRGSASDILGLYLGLNVVTPFPAP